MCSFGERSPSFEWLLFYLDVRFIVARSSSEGPSRMGIFHSATVPRSISCPMCLYSTVGVFFFLVNVVSAEDCCEKGKLEELYRHSFR